MEYIDLAKKIAEEAGEIILENFSLGMKTEWKDNNTPVTETDKRINHLVIERVREHFPDHSLRGEEESDLRESKYVWVCDPVDGTIPFSHGAPFSTFSLGLVEDGRVVVAVVFDPFMNRLYTAELGKGAFLNEKKLIVSEADDIKNTLIGIEWWKDCKLDYPTIIKLLADQRSQTLRLCSVIYSAMMVACGEATAVIFPGWEPHDMVTTKLIVEEAGGRVTDLEGNEQRYDGLCNGMIATNGKVHEKILGIVKPNLIA